MRRRALDLGRGDRGQVIYGIVAAPRHRPGGTTAADGPGRLARGKGPAGGAVQNPGTRRVVRAPRRDRRLLCVEIDGIVQPAPSPRFSRTVPDRPIPPQPPSDPEAAEAALAPWLDPA